MFIELEMTSSLYQHLTREHAQSLEFNALSPEHSQLDRAFLLPITSGK